MEHYIVLKSSEADADHGIYIHLQLRNKHHRCRAELQVDTGCSAPLILPTSTIQDLELNDLGVRRAAESADAGLKNGQMVACYYTGPTLDLLDERERVVCSALFTAVRLVQAGEAAARDADAEEPNDEGDDLLTDLHRPVHQVEGITAGRGREGEVALFGFAALKLLQIGLHPETRKLIMVKPAHHDTLKDSIEEVQIQGSFSCFLIEGPWPPAMVSC